MKKALFLLTLVLAISTSCNKDEPTKTDSQKIEGTWKPVKFTEKCIDEDIEIDIPGICDSKSRVIFKANGTTTWIDFYTDSLNECVSETYQETWNISEGKIYSTDDDETSVWDIEFFGSKFIISNTEEDCTSTAEFQKVN